MPKWLVSSLVITTTLIVWPVAFASSLRVQSEVQLEARCFYNAPQFAGQFSGEQLGTVFTADVSWRSRDRKSRFRFQPYLRLDSRDARRSYGDIRELSYTSEIGQWDYLVGVSQVFWGVAESRNVVDVINQFDSIEDIDEGEKLGQPMLRASRKFGPGRLEILYLPYFRERDFPGNNGRIRFPQLVDRDTIEYERSGNEWAGDFALRYTQRAGSLDLGVHAFKGTSRNPLLRMDNETGRLVQTYQSLDQIGIDAQFTQGAWLLKSEYVQARIGDETFSMAVAGFEYTFFGVGNRSLDVGLIGEYLLDTRDLRRTPITPFDNDVFVGTRITLNDAEDTELLAGVIVDDDTGEVQTTVEFQRRIGTSSLLEIEARSFHRTHNTLSEPFAQDDFVTMRWSIFF